jgi:hypothetical protein
MVLWTALPWRLIIDNVEAQFGHPPPPIKTEKPVERETLKAPEPPVAPAQRMRLGEELTLRVADHGRPSFVRCFKKAIDLDPTVTDFKVKLHIELDVVGNATSASTDAGTPALNSCLVRAAYGLPFPAPGKPAVVDLPLFYRGEP